MAKAELKPCPFCGIAGFTSGGFADGGIWLHVKYGCDKCEIWAPSAEAWNRRVEPAPAAPVDEFAVLAGRVRTFQAILDQAGAAPRAEHALILSLLRLMRPNLGRVRFSKASDEIAGYLGLKGDDRDE